MTNARTAYREADVRGASNVRLVVLLYEQAIQDLRQAAQAMDENKIEIRTSHINHALEIIGRLEGTLDKERGGKVACNLGEFYKTLRARLWQAQLHQSKEILLGQITDLFALREAWVEVDRIESKSMAPAVAKAPTPTLTPTPTTNSSRRPRERSEERETVSWNA